MDRYYDVPAGNGGNAGDGAAAGAALVGFYDIVWLGRSGDDVVSLSGTANASWGGRSTGWAGSGGSGVGDGYTVIFGVDYYTHGTVGGDGELSGDGGRGGDGTAEVVGAALFGGNGNNSITITLVSDAL